MAFDGASHNAPGLKTTPLTDPPPPVSEESKDAILKAAKKDVVGQHDTGDYQGEPLDKKDHIKAIAKPSAPLD